MLPKQTRHRDADPRIIRWIFEALTAGHGAEHYILGREAYPRHGDDWPAVDTHPPPFNFKPSSSEGSPFREVVGICYEAMTGAPRDPERAIKAFIRQRSRQVGQQVPEKGDLPS